jgi:hypothetical protein
VDAGSWLRSLRRLSRAGNRSQTREAQIQWFLGRGRPGWRRTAPSSARDPRGTGSRRPPKHHAQHPRPLAGGTDRSPTNRPAKRSTALAAGPGRKRRKRPGRPLEGIDSRTWIGRKDGNAAGARLEGFVGRPSSSGAFAAGLSRCRLSPLALCQRVRHYFKRRFSSRSTPSVNSHSKSYTKILKSLCPND